MDAVVITHLHADHEGGLSALRGLVSVGQVCLPAGARAKPSKTLSEADALVGDERVGELQAGGELKVGDIALDVVSPEDSSVDPATNEASIVMLARCGEESVLLTGDAESSILDRIVSQGRVGRVGVLKVGHHGSAISLDRIVLQSMAPQAAVISVGAGNRFRHPRPEPLSLLSAAAVPVLRTDLDGDVTLELGAKAIRLSGARSHKTAGPGQKRACGEPVWRRRAPLCETGGHPFRSVRGVP